MVNCANAACGPRSRANGHARRPSADGLKASRPDSWVSVRGTEVRGGRLDESVRSVVAIPHEGCDGRGPPDLRRPRYRQNRKPYGKKVTGGNRNKARRTRP